jgi:cobalt-zinc-cadmium efflux system outer membrane protein
MNDGKQTHTFRVFQYAIAFTAALFLPSSVYGDTGAEENPFLTERAAVLFALKDNPGLASMQFRYEALLEVPSQVGTLPDPIVNVNAMNFPTDSFDRDQEAMTQLQVGFSQVFPFPGKLGLTEEAASFDAMTAGFSVDELRVQLANN